MPYQQKPDQMSDKKSQSQYFIRRALAMLDSLQKSSQAHANKMQILGSRSHTHTTITLLSKLHANFGFSLLPRTAGYNGAKIILKSYLNYHTLDAKL